VESCPVGMHSIAAARCCDDPRNNGRHSLAVDS
jgi:hypothetical protein